MPTDIAKISDFTAIFNNIVTDVLGFAAIVLFIVLLVGGFKFITSGGDPKALDSAKKSITGGLAGLIIILVAYLILVLIKIITGVDVTKFNVVLP
jgi:hypothetical protein